MYFHIKKYNAEGNSSISKDYNMLDVNESVCLIYKPETESC